MVAISLHHHVLLTLILILPVFAVPISWERPPPQPDADDVHVPCNKLADQRNAHLLVQSRPCVQDSIHPLDPYSEEHRPANRKSLITLIKSLKRLYPKTSARKVKFNSAEETFPTIPADAPNPQEATHLNDDASRGTVGKKSKSLLGKLTRKPPQTPTPQLDTDHEKQGDDFNVPLTRVATYRPENRPDASQGVETPSGQPKAQRWMNRIGRKSTRTRPEIPEDEKSAPTTPAHAQERPTHPQTPVHPVVTSPEKENPLPAPRRSGLKTFLKKLGPKSSQKPAPPLDPQQAEATVSSNAPPVQVTKPPLPDLDTAPSCGEALKTSLKKVGKKMMPPCIKKRLDEKNERNREKVERDKLNSESPGVVQEEPQVQTPPLVPAKSKKTFRERLRLGRKDKS